MWTKYYRTATLQERFRPGKCKYCQEEIIWVKAGDKYIPLNTEYHHSDANSFGSVRHTHSCKIENPKFKMGDVLTYTNKNNERKLYRVLGIVMNRNYCVEEIIEIIDTKLVAKPSWEMNIKLLDEKGIPVNLDNYKLLFDKEEKITPVAAKDIDF